MVSKDELEKQRGELQAWIDIAKNRGPEFMKGQPIPEDQVEAYRDKVLVDVGCGPRPFVQFFPARVPIMVDCCMMEYAKADLLQASTLEGVHCIDGMAESLPFATGSVDILFAINMLDHTFDPQVVVTEYHRVLRVGGACHVHVDIGGETNVCEPIVFSDEDVRGLFSRFKMIFHETAPPSNPGRDHVFRGIFIKEHGVEGEVVRGRDDFAGMLISPDDGSRLAPDGTDGYVSAKTRQRYRRTDGVWDFKPQTT